MGIVGKQDMRRQSVFKSSDIRNGGVTGLVEAAGAWVVVVVARVDAEEGVVREPTLHARLRQISPRLILIQK